MKALCEVSVCLYLLLGSKKIFFYVDSLLLSAFSFTTVKAFLINFENLQSN